MTANTLTLDQLKGLIAQKATEDAEFRAALLAGPKAAVADLLGTDLPGHVQIQIIEEAPDTYVVVLPAPRPASGELSDADLESVAGGAAKADQPRIARHAASAIFGGGAAFGALIVGGIAKAAGDNQTRVQANDAAATIATCG